MTVQEAIRWMDEKKHNVYSREDKLAWLFRLETTAAEFMGRYADCGCVHTVSCPEDFQPDDELLIPAPFDDLYLYHLEAQMDYCAQEYTRYNNASAMFRAQWDAFTAWYNRTHTYRGESLRI